MSFPERIHAKISSEAAGSISFSRVVRQDMTAAELMEQIVRVTGKDRERIREVLRQGTLVSGASRFRWEPIDAAPEEIAPLLAAFPDALPHRPFDPTHCVRARLTGGRAPIDLERDTASQKRWLARSSFWDAVLEAAGGAIYQHYSYADCADVYHAELTPESVRVLRGQANLLRYPTLETSVREYAYTKLELWVER